MCRNVKCPTFRNVAELLRILFNTHPTGFIPLQELLKDFVDEEEWGSIIAECDPEFLPPEGELLGLRNIHVFSLANVLRRPIILLDSLAGMQSLGDYAALFLPSLVEPERCRGGPLNRRNPPLCLSWSSSGRNHYIPLVGVRMGKRATSLYRHWHLFHLESP